MASVAEATNVLLDHLHPGDTVWISDDLEVRTLARTARQTPRLVTQTQGYLPGTVEEVLDKKVLVNNGLTVVSVPRSEPKKGKPATKTAAEREVLPREVAAASLEGVDNMDDLPHLHP
jgi:hypothetical protein